METGSQEQQALVSRAVMRAAQQHIVDSVGNQAGNAMIETLIALPFLVTIVFSVLDISLVLREYYFLSDAVSAGAERAMTDASMASGTDYASGIRPGCIGEIESGRVHGRIEELVDLHSLHLRDICILSHRESAGQNTVRIQAVASYEGFLPPFDGITIAAEARVPYLLN